MSTIDRTSYEDSKKVVEHLLPDHLVRQKLLKFLSNAIIYSNGLKPDNWNLNLDKNGAFIRFNVGHAYCVQISKAEILIIGLKTILKDELNGKNIEIKFLGYQGNKKVSSYNLYSVPDCLVKVPDSVECIIAHKNILYALPHLEEANRHFISYAINNTIQLTQMKNAHSTGFIEYLSEFSSKYVPNPVYSTSEESFYRNREAEERKAKKLDTAELKEKIKNSQKSNSKRISVATTKFNRNPYVVEYAKRVANGICQDCNQPAPFVNKLTKEPFLETHHIIPLAEGGMDTIENTIALCPNCHRKRHYG